MSDAQHQSLVNTANAAFWDELCETTMAHQMGITEHTAQSLQRFDQRYFEFYPYLERHILLLP